MTSVSKYMYIDKLDDIVNKYNTILNMFLWEYNLTISNNNQTLFISVQTENNKNKI